MQTRFFAVLALLLLSGVSYQLLNPPSKPNEKNIQRQEEVENFLVDVFYQARNEEEEKIIDLLWLQEAAQVAREQEAKYFNIVEQNIGINKELTYMEGIIEITDDINAEFSVEEITRVNIEEL
ncbi:MAG TPA: hypothetical protein VKY27_01405 [Bacteriovoracaceae bacterium]|nr:hypothetical protein [Bacteriovoracaceae bacterium]